MIIEIIVETNAGFEGCNDCVHSDDTCEMCKIRGCIHAIRTEDIREYYQPKLSTKRRRGKNDSICNNKR